MTVKEAAIRVLKAEASPLHTKAITAMILSRGLVWVPHEEQICRDVLAGHDCFIQQRDRYVRELIKEHTADEDMQEAIFEAAMPLLRKK